MRRSFLPPLPVPVQPGPVDPLEEQAVARRLGHVWWIIAIVGAVVVAAQLPPGPASGAIAMAVVLVLLAGVLRAAARVVAWAGAGVQHVVHRRSRGLSTSMLDPMPEVMTLSLDAVPADPVDDLIGRPASQASAPAWPSAS